MTTLRKMSPRRAFLLLCSGLCILAVCPAAAATGVGPDAGRIRALADRYYAFRLQTHPEIAYFSGVTIDRHDGLADNRPVTIAKARAAEDAMFLALDEIDPSKLVQQVDWITYAYLRQELNSARDLRVCRNELWGVSQMDGWQLNFTQLADLQPVGTPALREQALARWAKVPGWIDQEIVNLRTGLAAGYSAPRPAAGRVLEQLDGLLAIPAAESPFASPARRDDDEAFSEQFMVLVSEQILPAVRRYRDFIAATYLEQARTALSITANPNGRACYEASLRAYTTVDRSPEEVFELGRATVAANHDRVVSLGRAAYGLDDYAAIIERIKTDPENRFRDAEDLLGFSRETLTRAQAALSAWFGRVPMRPAVVEPYPEYQDGSGVSMRYEPGAGERPGVFRISLFQPQEQGRGNAEATAFHEVWPGHHLQVSLAQEIQGLHPITKICWYSGMGEGWARYAEGLADEMGLYRTVAGPIGRLAWPARGMVVDPGIHVMGWTREQAVAFMAESGRMTEHELEEMVDRISVLPGQLTAYDTGALEIVALRRQAEEQFGESFDIREFHDRLLENGTLPLGALRTYIEAWLATHG